MLSTGPHFVEYLDFTVTEECDVLLKCKVRRVPENIYAAINVILKTEHHENMASLHR